MFDLYLESLAKDIQSLKKTLAAHEGLRDYIYGISLSDTHDGAARPEFLTSLAENLPDRIAWTLFDRAAAFTRLYAIYEKFVFRLVADWLKALPEFYPAYNDLPKNIQDAHCLGVGKILTKITGDRYKDIGEKRVVTGLFQGVSGLPNYTLLPEAFLIDDQNLWKEILSGLFSRSGLGNCWKWITNHKSVIGFFAEVHGENSSPESELSNFIQYRNEAAHGDLEDTVSIKIIENYADFIVILCEVLSELVAHRVIEKKIDTNLAINLGQVIHKFSGNRVGVQLIDTHIKCGDILYAQKENFCTQVRVQGLGYKKTILHDHINITNGNLVCLQLDRPISMGAEIIRIGYQATMLPQHPLMLCKPAIPPTTPSTASLSSS